MILRRAARLVAALTIAAGLLGPARGEDISPDQARAIALTASVRGDWRLAYELGETLLVRDPDDLPALLAVARAAPRLGKADRGIEAARHAFEIAPNRLQKFNAAFLLGQAEYGAGHNLRSQFWLRRAASLAQTDRQRAAVAQSYRQVRTVSPLNLQLTFGIRPTSNANSGSSASEISYGGLIFGLGGAAQALPGVEYSAGVTLRYLLRGDDDRGTRLYASAYARTYTLNPEALAAAPGAKGSDYSLGQVQLGLTHDRRAGTNGALGFAAIAGRSVYGGAPLMNNLILSGTYYRTLSPRTRLSFALTGEKQWRLDQTVRSADIVTLAIGGTTRRTNGDALRAELQLARAASQSAIVANDKIGLSLGYDFARQIGGLQFGLTASVAARHFPQSIFVAGARDDIETSLGLSTVVTRINYFGFSPRLDLAWTRNQSTDDLYDRREIGLKLGLQSNF